MTGRLRIAVVVASSRPRRIGGTVAQWVHAGTRQREGVDYELVDLAEQDLPNLDEPVPASSGRYTRDHTRAWSATVSRYDAFVFVTPEYNRGMPGQLKNALDFLYSEWNDKAAGLVCYGSSGGLRVAEQLKTVLGELQVATVRAQVSLSTYDDMERFTVLTPRAFQARNLQEMLRQTERWAAALKPLRSEAGQAGG